MPSTLFFSLLLLLPLVSSSSAAAVFSSAATTRDRANKSSWGGTFWATAKDESDLYTSADDSADLHLDDGEEAEEFAGGFSSLDGMLQWAVGHSDPEKLKEGANDVKRLSPDELRERQLEIKELMEKVKMPSDGELMKIAIDDLNNSSTSLENRRRALDELLILVEPIDNANDLYKLGGLTAIVRELYNVEPVIRTTSAWILGKACQNNPIVQKQILALGALSRLMMMIKSSHTEEAIKAFYAVSALIRNNNHGMEIFYAEAGELLLLDVMSNLSMDIRLLKKAVFLVTDLVDFQLEHAGNMKISFFTNHLLLKSVVDLISSSDLDLQEKALMAIRSLLQLPSTEALVFKDVCALDKALARMREQLEKLMISDEHRDFVTDIEALRMEVEVIFHRKLEKVTPVPT